MVALQKADIEALERNAEAASALLKAMSNERRLLIMCHLAGGESSVGDLERRVGLSQSRGRGDHVDAVGSLLRTR
jgi:DNA-binding HxlR family transcriptional regulator